MVRFVANDLETAIDLLQQDDAHHLMGEGHGRKGKFEICPPADCGRQPQRAAYDEDDEGYDDDDDYSSHSSSSSSTLLDEDDWVDTDDGKTYLKSDSKDGGTDYIDTDGEYAIHKNADGTGAIADGNGNKAVDNDGDGKLDSYSTDNGKTWNSLE